MPWDGALFDTFFDPAGPWQSGRTVSWERARICSCQRRQFAGAPSVECKLCFGTGRCYADATEVSVGVSGYSVRREHKEYGPYPQGEVTITIPVNVRDESGQFARSALYDEVGDYDRFTLLDAQERRERVLVKDVDDKHGEPTIVQVLSCRVSADKNTELTFAEGTDFVVEGQLVHWLRGPLKGTRYVLDVLARPTFYVINSRSMHRNHGGVELPKRIVAVPADLLDRSRRSELG